MQDKSNNAARIVYVVIAVLVLSLGGWLFRDTIRGWFGDEPAPAIDELEPVAVEPAPTVEPEQGAGEPVLGEAEQRWAGLVGAAPTWPLDLSDPPECESIQRSFDRVCRTLGTRGYLRPGTDVCALLREAAPRLARRPPVASGELRSYVAVLANAFHLFRSLGRERLDTLRRIAAEEDALAEPLALVGYRWMLSRETCDPDSGITRDTLYEYAAFLTQTLGGQAYLRRRPPRVEALATFWSLVALEDAVERGVNPHGVDPRPELARARGLLQGRSLVFDDRYLEWIDTAERRWESRSASRN